jgi:hypothetical protein
MVLHRPVELAPVIGHLKSWYADHRGHRDFPEEVVTLVGYAAILRQQRDLFIMWTGGIIF